MRLDVLRYVNYVKHLCKSNVNTEHQNHKFEVCDQSHGVWAYIEEVRMC